VNHHGVNPLLPCKQRGKAGHLPPLARCGDVLSAGDCKDARAVATHDNQFKGMTAPSTLSKLSP
jgi:hypothetical protein